MVNYGCPSSLQVNINSYYVVNFPSIVWIPLAQPINSYYVVNFPSVSQVPLVQPINSYYMVIRCFDGGIGGNDSPSPSHVIYHLLTLQLRRR